MRAEVAERAIVRRVTMKDTMAMDVQCVLAIIVHHIIIKVRKAISLAKVINQEKVAISLVLATIAKVAISKEKADIVQDRIAKAAINQEKAIKTAKAVISRERVISLAIVKAIPPKGEPKGASVLAPLATILMRSTA